MRTNCKHLSTCIRFNHFHPLVRIFIFNNIWIYLFKVLFYQFLTKKKYHPIVNQLQAHRSKKKLSQTAIETLAIIAYKQPITKLEIEQIRGVNCDYTIQKLLEKELITITGKADTVGKPILYSTSSIFMDYFGINSIADLPRSKEVISDNNEIGAIKE